VTVDSDRLRPLPLFADLSDAQRKRVAAWMEERTADEGERIVPEGTAGYEFYVIESGTVEVTREGALIRTLGPGDFFGEMALVGSSARRAASVVATSPLRELETQLPDVAERIRARMLARLAE
jgi:CRP-like cAMP-binding protein